MNDIQQPLSAAWPPGQEPGVEVVGYTKTIRGKTVLRDVSLSVPKGQIGALRGHNGSGKTMLLRGVCGLVHPTSGTVRLFGETLHSDIALPRDVGVIIEHPGFLAHLSGFENLRLLASIKKKIGHETIAEAISLYGLDPSSRDPVRTYSLGMLQRLALAQATMESPVLLLLDEPTSGLDSSGVELFIERMKEQRARGVTILFSTHDDRVADSLADACYSIENGEIK